MLPRFAQRSPSWDRTLPLAGGVLLFLQVWPPPVFGLNWDSAFLLAQIPLFAACTWGAVDRNWRLAWFSALALAILQCRVSWMMVPQVGWRSLDVWFPPVLWIGVLASAFHPARREVYLGKGEPPKEKSK
jgi:hypothetical protein